MVLQVCEDGVTVEINIGKPMMGTYNDMKKLAKGESPHMSYDGEKPDVGHFCC